jgi:predicted nucleic acid-binding protein
MTYLLDTNIVSLELKNNPKIKQKRVYSGF